MNELVSIIVPVYNVEKFLPRCVESLLSQTYKNIQIVVVNDGSKDNSLEVARKYEKQDKRVVVLTKENQGLSHTRNTGLNFLLNQENKKTKYICFIDSDDYVSPVFVETLYTALKQNNADISVVTNCRVSEKQNLEYKHIFRNKFNPQKYKRELYNETEAMKQLFSGKKFGVGPCNKMYRAEMINSKNPVRFPEDIKHSEDIPFVYEMFSKSKKVVFVPKANYAYTKRNGSLVRSKFNPKKLTTFKGLNYCCENCQKNLPDAYSYVAGWRALSNFEMLYYMFRDRYFDYDVYNQIVEILKKDMKHLTKSRKFPLYRRALLPFGTWLLKKLYRRRFKNEFKKFEIKK